MSEEPEEVDGEPLPLWARIIRGLLAVLIPLGMLATFVAGAVWGIVHDEWYSYTVAVVCGALMWAWTAAMFELLAERHTDR